MIEKLKMVCVGYKNVPQNAYTISGILVKKNYYEDNRTSKVFNTVYFSFVFEEHEYRK